MSDANSKQVLAEKASNTPTTSSSSPFARRRSNRYGTWILLGIMALSAGLGFALVERNRNTAQPQETVWLVFAAEDIPPAAVRAHLEKPFHGAIVLGQDGLAQDTFLSVRDYSSWLANQPLSVPAPEPDAWAVSSEEPEEAFFEEESPLALILKGRLQSQQRIIFAVSGFRDQHSYTLDFGDGYRQEIRRQAAYMYAKPGYYQVKLTMTTALGQIKQRVRTIHIQSPTTRAGNPTQQQPSTLVIADFNEELDEVMEDANSYSQDATASFIPSAIEENNQTELIGPPKPDSLFSHQGNPEIGDQPRSEAKPFAVTDEPYIMPEVAPEFPFGSSEMKNFLDANIVYPELATDLHVEGTVVARFVVDREGNISDVTILKGIGYGCDREVKRVIRKMPNWKPGEIDGQKVNSYFVLPVKFILRD